MHPVCRLPLASPTANDFRIGIYGRLHVEQLSRLRTSSKRSLDHGVVINAFATDDVLDAMNAPLPGGSVFPRTI